MKNVHLPLPEGTYQALRAEAERSKDPATALAREAISAWLRVRKKGQRRGAIAKFAPGPPDLPQICRAPLLNRPPSNSC